MCGLCGVWDERCMCGLVLIQSPKFTNVIISARVFQLMLIIGTEHSFSVTTYSDHPPILSRQLSKDIFVKVGAFPALHLVWNCCCPPSPKNWFQDQISAMFFEPWIENIKVPCCFLLFHHHVVHSFCRFFCDASEFLIALYINQTFTVIFVFSISKIITAILGTSYLSLNPSFYSSLTYHPPPYTTVEFPFNQHLI